MIRYLYLTALLVMSLTGPACGEDESGSRPSTDPPSADAGRLDKPEYEARFRDVLDEARRTNDAAERAGASEAERLETAAASLETAAKRLDALSPPGEVAQAHADFVAVLEHQQERMQAYVELVAAGKTAEAERLVETEPSPEIARRARAMRETFARLGYDIGTEPPAP